MAILSEHTIRRVLWPSNAIMLKKKLRSRTKLLLCSFTLLPICGKPSDRHRSDSYGDDEAAEVAAEFEKDDVGEAESQILHSPLILRTRVNGEGSSSSSHGKPRTPRGCLAVYVGEEEEKKRRFVVEAEMVNHPLFGVLLDMAKEEFGFEQQGPLCIPCDLAFFHRIMLLLRSNDPSSLRDAESLLRSLRSSEASLRHPHGSNSIAQ